MTKFFIAGLRPDLISADCTPDLMRLKSLGPTLSHHPTIYPNETRVAFLSFVTGAGPNKHGMVGNKSVDRQTVPPRSIDRVYADLLHCRDLEIGEGLMTTHTLGECLHGARSCQGNDLSRRQNRLPSRTLSIHDLEAAEQ
ncbi:alkaline phosphatase family protein [Xaviernesmea oryzae]|uniref:alkaline phosphatase family protein n=1 Tax=Xaviernesmea oryzae TaxID=464029 RepID=UPI000AE95B82|nr:alkaline phosphatase family protein [Xaviernesmea oryzae]